MGKLKGQKLEINKNNKKKPFESYPTKNKKFPKKSKKSFWGGPKNNKKVFQITIL